MDIYLKKCIFPINKEKPFGRITTIVVSDWLSHPDYYDSIVYPYFCIHDLCVCGCAWPPAYTSNTQPCSLNARMTHIQLLTGKEYSV